jgi:hypothetical protein
MSNDNLARNPFRLFSWKFILLFLSLPILMNIVNEVMELLHFNTFSGSPGDEFIANVAFHVGNWPSLLLKLYPYVLTTDGDVVYEVSGWIKPAALTINLIGWGLLGFITSYIIQKSKRPALRNKSTSDKGQTI